MTTFAQIRSFDRRRLNMFVELALVQVAPLQHLLLHEVHLRLVYKHAHLADVLEVLKGDHKGRGAEDFDPRLSPRGRPGS